MTIRRLCIAVVLLFTATGLSQAGWFELAFNDQAFDVSGGFHFGKDPEQQFALGGRYLSDDDQDAQVAAIFAGFAIVPDSKEGLELNLGVQLLTGESGSQDVGAAAIGAVGNWTPPNLHGFYFGGSFFYGPSVFSWADTEGYLEWSARGGYKITPKIAVFVEYQRVEAEFVGLGDRELNDGVLFGFAGRF